VTALIGALIGFAGAATLDHRRGTRVRAAPSALASIFPNGVRTLDGSGNNERHPEWGAVGTTYSRVAAAVYADGLGAMRAGPPARYVSNRVFNDLSQNLFSENGVTQWAFTWGQFLDHTFGLRQVDGERAPIPFDAADPLEAFEADTPIEFRRTPAGPGTGKTSPREQTNTVSSYIDAWSVYGGTAERLEWLREGPVDGDLSNNGARLLTAPAGYLPSADSRGDASAAPTMELRGRLAVARDEARIAGDVRANENALLTSVHTLFVREHNRIVDALPRVLSEQVKFEIARRVVSAELQYDRAPGRRRRLHGRRAAGAARAGRRGQVGERGRRRGPGRRRGRAGRADARTGTLFRVDAHALKVTKRARLGVFATAFSRAIATGGGAVWVAVTT